MSIDKGEIDINYDESNVIMVLLENGYKLEVEKIPGIDAFEDKYRIKFRREHDS